MTTLKQAQSEGDLERFIAEREAEGQAPGDTALTDATIRRFAETPSANPRALKRDASDG